MGNALESPPLIDMGSLLGVADPQHCADAMHGACLDWGFFVVVGHGLDDQIADLFKCARRFFAQPQHHKELTPRSDRYGYVPRAVDAIDQHRQTGITEYLDMGLGDEVALPEVDDFERSVRSYQRDALDVAAAVLGAMGEMLGAGPTFFADRMQRPQCRLRMIHYPPVEPGPDGEPPVTNHPHTDYGAITLLATDGVPGLQVQGRDDAWRPVSAPEGALIVNLGDMLARWTNEVYVSTPHRVVGPIGGNRISVPYFINPDPDTIVEAIASCVTSERPLRHEPVTAGEFLARRIDGR